MRLYVKYVLSVLLTNWKGKYIGKSCLKLSNIQKNYESNRGGTGHLPGS